ncbi:MAG: AI-2E family transporter [Abditibacteriota bacterium]|nr:AI-2E family transporter [Abditibacteriota bacterium]
MKAVTPRTIYGAVCLTLILLLLAKFAGAMSSVIISLALSAILAAALDAPVSWLERRRVSRSVGTFLCVVAALGLAVFAVRLVAPMVSSQAQALSDQCPRLVKQLDAKAEKYLKTIKVDPRHLDLAKLDIKPGAVAKGVAGSAAWVGQNALSALTGAFLVIVFTIYILIEPRPLIKGALHPWPADVRKKIRRCLIRIKKAISYWVVGLMLGSCCIFLLTWLGLSLIRMPNAFLFAVIAGLMNIIPTLGPILSAVPPVLIAIITNPVMILKVIVVYVVVQQCEGHLVTPLVMQKQLSIHPVVLLFSIFVMGTLFGVAGIFITAPVVASVGIIYDEFYAKEARRRAGKSSGG